MKMYNNTKVLSAIVATLVFVISQSLIVGSGQSAAANIEGPGEVYNYKYIDPTVDITTAPAVDVRSASVNVGQVTSIPVTLSDASTGVAGFLVELSVADAEVASIVSVEFPEYGLTYNVPSEDGGFRIAAADIFGLVEAGNESVRLFTINVAGLSEGTTNVNLSVVKMDDDEGDAIVPDASFGTVTVY